MIGVDLAIGVGRRSLEEKRLVVCQFLGCGCRGQLACPCVRRDSARAGRAARGTRLIVYELTDQW